MRFFWQIRNNQGRGKCYQPSRTPRLITLTETLIIQDITKKESNNYFIIRCFEENKDTKTHHRNRHRLFAAESLEKDNLKMSTISKVKLQPKGYLLQTTKSLWEKLIVINRRKEKATKPKEEVNFFTLKRVKFAVKMTIFHSL